MILSGSEIQNALNLGRIHIFPFQRGQLNEASYDLTLGSMVKVYTFPEMKCLDPKNPKSLAMETRMVPPSGMTLYPGEGYLLHTEERITTDHYVACIDGKSTLGRMFVLVHYTAGFVDPGFDGQYTLEVSALYPTRVYPGMRIAQVRFHTVQGLITSYKDRGQYVGERALGPVEPGTDNLFRHNPVCGRVT